jgi:hypothetical protein
MHIVQDQGLGRSRLLETGRVQTDAGATSVQRCTRVTLVLGDAGVATLFAAADEGIRCRPLSEWKTIHPFTFASWYSPATLIQFTWSVFIQLFVHNFEHQCRLLFGHSLQTLSLDTHRHVSAHTRRQDRYSLHERLRGLHHHAGKTSSLAGSQTIVTNTDSPRYLDVAALPVSSAETRYGLFLESAAHSAVLLSTESISWYAEAVPLAEIHEPVLTAPQNGHIYSS